MFRPLPILCFVFCVSCFPTGYNPPHMPILPDPSSPQARMSFGEHLEELRKRVIRALLGSLILVAVCLIYYKEILALVSRPYILVARAHHLPDVFGTLKPQEAFLTSVTLAFQVGLILSSP